MEARCPMKASIIRRRGNGARIAAASLIWVALWWALSASVGREVLLPSPASAASALVALMGTGGYYASLAGSFARILIGFALAAAAGASLASLSFAFPPAADLLAPMMSAAKATPVASFVVLALLYLKAGYLSVFTSFLMVLPIVYSSTLAGLRDSDMKLREMARVFRVGAGKRARAIYAPSAFPYFIAACESSLGMSWKAGVAAEVIGQTGDSVGSALYYSKLYLKTPELFAWTISVILVSVALERAAMALLSRARLAFGGRPK